VKSRHVLWLALSAVLLLAGLRAGYAQPTPVGPVIQVNTTTKRDQLARSVAADAAGRFAVVWTDECDLDPDVPCSESPDGSISGVFGRWFDASGQPAGAQVQLNTTAEGFQGSPDVAVGADGRFFTVWWSEGRILGRFFDATGTPLGGEVVLVDETADRSSYSPSVAPWPGGGYALAWLQSFAPSYTTEVRVRRLDAAGQPVSDAVRADAGEVSIYAGPDLAVAEDGSLAVTWLASSLDPIRARLLSSSLEPVGAELLVAKMEPGWASYSPVVVARPGGGFLVAWDADGALGHDIFDRTLDADGAAARLGEVVRVSDDGLFNFDAALVPDPYGGLLAAWSHGSFFFPVSQLYGRRLDARGEPAGPAAPLGVDVAGAISRVIAATTPNGFVVAWTSDPDGGPSPDGEGTAVQLRRFVVSASGEDLCLFGAGGFSCDLLRDGGADLVLDFGSSADRPLMGDFDGDGRDDPCFFQSGRFACDTDRNGLADLGFAFDPGAGDPLLGDVNGDGRDDACFHSGRRFLCDTARDGGTAELVVAFGRAAGDVPLLGDLDGDQDDEPCVFRGGQLLCDLAHDGGAPELTLTVAFSGTPLLGDMDGDGRDDLCLARDGVLRCDTAHDGGGAELEITYDPAAGVPLLGNVDGYGVSRRPSAAARVAPVSGQEIQINTYTEGRQSYPAVAMDRRGNAVVVWQDDGPAGPGLQGRIFGPTGAPRGDQFLVSKVAEWPEVSLSKSVALDGSGFVVAWSEGRSSYKLFSREMKLDGSPAGPPFQLAETGYGRIALGPDGRFLLVWLDAKGMFAQLRERSGRPAGDRVTLAGPENWPAVARHGDAGYVVVWDGLDNRILGVFVDAAGRPSGQPFLVAGGQQNVDSAEVASAPDGRFVVSWVCDSPAAVYARSFGASGAPLTPVLQVLGPHSSGGSGDLSVAMDAEGKFLVIWNQYDQIQERDDGNVYGRRYESSGAPAGGPFRVSLFVPGTQLWPAVAAGPAGDFFAAWATDPGWARAPAQDGSDSGIFGRRLPWARPGSDPCAFSPAGFACDTAHDGGQAELVLPFHGAQDDRPLFGDLDGDGRDDPCLFHAGTFLCDTAHDGNPAPGIVYGQAGDVPLLADFDGEGRDDACVRRGTWFLCDTAHDGGGNLEMGEMAISFGDAADLPLVGDVDGDGDDDPCVRRGATFLCDTVHDGLDAEVSISFGKPGDPALLGDLNGDGRADPCVIQGGRLLCDTAHDGGQAELSVRFTLPGVPLLGDVDGL
jgi:hypothetical protein